MRSNVIEAAIAGSLGLLFALGTYHAYRRGEFERGDDYEGRTYTRRSESPISFWIEVILGTLVSVFCIAIAIRFLLKV